MENLAAAAAALGIPEELAERSARARASAQGVSVEEILGAWAGGGTIAPAAAPAPEPAAPDTEEDASDGAGEETPAAPEPTPVEQVAVPASVGAAPVAPAARAIPDTVSWSEASDWDVVTTVPTSGLKERTSPAVPTWLTSLFVVVPLIGLFILLGRGEATCGQAGALAEDPITGAVVNCDESEFVPGGSGSVTDFLALGEVAYSQTAACAACHGANGEGVGAFPQLSGGMVVETFPSCDDHVTWVELGSAQWAANVGPTYGATDKPVGGAGQMTGFGDALTDEELRSVVAFERVRFGGVSPDEALVDCGLVEPAGEEAPAEGEEVPAEGTGTEAMGSNG